MPLLMKRAIVKNGQARRTPNWNSGSECYAGIVKAKPMWLRLGRRRRGGSRLVSSSNPDNGKRRPNEDFIAMFVDHGGASADAGAVHEPDLGFVGLTLVPDDVGLPVTVEIASPDNRKRRPNEDFIAMFVDHGGASADAGDVHEPDLGFVGLTLVPNDVGLLVTVEIANPDNRKRGPNEDFIAMFVDYGGASADAGAVHEPDLGFVGLTLVPNDVGLPVTVEIANPDNRKRRPNEDFIVMFVDYGGASANAGAVHEPDLSFVGLTLVPDDVRVPIAVEIANPNDRKRRPNEDFIAMFVDYGGASANAGAVHEPDLGFVGLTIVKNDVSC